MIRLKLPDYKKWLGWPKFSRTGILLAAAAIGIVGLVAFQAQSQINKLDSAKKNVEQQLASTQNELADLKNLDQYKKNKELGDTIKNIENTYQGAVATYEQILSLNPTGKTAADLNIQFASALSFLSKHNYASASATLATINQQIDTFRQGAATSLVPASAAPNNTPPGSGYSRQLIHSDAGDFVVDIIAADLSSTRVLVDTASDSTCTNNCPVLPLSTYVSRTGGFAGINGSYFCPASYPTCAGKTNSFDTLLMNKNKVYFNSDNNVYSTVPAVVFGNGWIRFVGRSSDWGRDTGIDSMIAMQPLLLSGGNVVFGGNSDPKEGAKGGRSFVGTKGSTIYIGVVFNATVAESARALKALGLSDALNLDDGGSVALWSGGYKAGPGRDIPNAIVFVRK